MHLLCLNEVKRMNVYMTSGTYGFMKSLKEKHPSERILLMESGGEATLLHETVKDTVFQTPRKYEVIDSVGELADRGFIVCNNISVTDEGRPVFEYRFENREHEVEKARGFLALRVLRPINSNTYVILTQWTSSEAYTNWTDSPEFKKAHEQQMNEPGVNKEPHIFSSKPYITTYNIPKEE